MVARTQILPDAIVVPAQHSKDLTITQALLRLLDEIVPPEPDAQTESAGAAQVPSAG
jgi:hypothetical protein